MKIVCSKQRTRRVGRRPIDESFNQMSADDVTNGSTQGEPGTGVLKSAPRNSSTSNCDTGCHSPPPSGSHFPPGIRQLASQAP